MRGGDEARRERGHAREASEEVERGPLRREDRPQWTAHLHEGLARAHGVAVGGPPVDDELGPDTGKGLRGAGAPGQHPVAARPQCATRRDPFGHQRRGQVALGPEVLGQGAGHRVAHRRRVLRLRLAPAHAPPPATRSTPGAPCTSRRRQVGSVSGNSRRAWAPRLSVRASAASRSASASCEQVRQLSVSGRSGVGAERGCDLLERRARAGQRLGTAHDPGAAGHGALERVAQLGHVGPGLRDRAEGQGGRVRGEHGGADPVDGLATEHGPQRAARLGPRRARRDPLGQAGSEDHAFEQRVGGQAVGPVHARAGHLAHRPQPAERGGAPQVGDHAARKVVGGRRDGQPVPFGIEADGCQGGGDGREPRGEALEPRGVEPEMVYALDLHGGRHGPAHHVTRRQFVDEARAVAVAQERTVAAQRFGQERAGHGGMVQRGRMELHELHVGHGHPGPQCHGDTVPRRLGRVGGDREQLARAARRQHDVAGAHVDCPGRTGRRAGTGRQRAHSHAAPVLDQELEREPPLEDRGGGAIRGIDERAFDLGSGGRAPACTTRGAEWPPSRAKASDPVASRSNSTPSAISSCTRPGPSSTRMRTASSSQSPAPAASVSARWRSVESSSPPSTAATPPWAHRVADCDSAPLVSTPRARPGPPAATAPARRTAADSPATPLPSTRTSKGPGRSASVTPVRSASAPRRDEPTPRR